MKKFNYLSGVLTGIAAAVAVFLLVSHKPASEPALPEPVVKNTGSGIGIIR